MQQSCEVMYFLSYMEYSLIAQTRRRIDFTNLGLKKKILGI